MELRLPNWNAFITYWVFWSAQAELRVDKFGYKGLIKFVHGISHLSMQANYTGFPHWRNSHLLIFRYFSDKTLQSFGKRLRKTAVMTKHNNDIVTFPIGRYNEVLPIIIYELISLAEAETNWMDAEQRLTRSIVNTLP